MPKLGQQELRRAALIQATIDEIGVQGTLDVTVGQIARRAGMSPALAHHYFGSKAAIFLAAMQRILSDYAREVRRMLADAPQGRRLEALIAANFAERYLAPETVAAWLNFYVLARTDAQAARLLRVYQRRLHSNLVYALRSRSDTPEADARTIAALIDGVYLRAALAGEGMQGATARVTRAAHALIRTSED